MKIANVTDCENTHVKRFAQMESTSVFSLGLLFFNNTISKIKHSSLPQYFLRAFKFLKGLVTLF